MASIHHNDLIIALAGLFQAAGLVHEIAHGGRFSGETYATCIDSLLKIDADNSEDVYGGLQKLRPGLHLLIEQLRQPSDMETTRYVLSLLVLERKLRGRQDLQQTLQQGIEQAQRLMQHFAMEQHDMTARLAELYSTTISTLKPRIMVNGAYEHLNRPDNANRIRALLLAGIRSAVLWRQKGGGRLTLLLRRKTLITQAQSLLDSLPLAPSEALESHGDV